MAYLRKKRDYYYLVQGIRDPETKKVKQVTLKYYGHNKPTEEQLQEDIAELGTTRTETKGACAPDNEKVGTTEPEALVDRGHNKSPAPGVVEETPTEIGLEKQPLEKVVVPTNGFDVNARITKDNINSIIGTIWRNRYTHSLAIIEKINKTPSGSFELYSRMEKSDKMGDIVTWLTYRELWKNAMNHWYRIDDIGPADQLEGFRKRVGYCKDELNRARKALHKLETVPKDERHSPHSTNLGIRKQQLEWTQRDYDAAQKDLEAFLKDYGPQLPETPTEPQISS